MRKIEFSELKLKTNSDEQTFYEVYLKNLQKEQEDNKFLEIPKKQHEIIYLNILGGKIILLNTDYIDSENDNEKELFFDYSIAYKIYNLMLDIEDGIEDEKNEFNELYKDERLKKNEEIEELKKKDEKLFQKKTEEYYIIINSDVYEDYSRLKIENEKMKLENKKLTERLDNMMVTKNNNIGFFRKIINRLTTKKLPID